MSITYRSSTSSAGSGTSITLSKPSGVVDGDLLVAVLCSRGPAGSAVTLPSGWSMIDDGGAGSGRRGTFCYKVASSEPSSWTWQTNESSYGSSGVVTAYSVSGTATLDVHGTAFDQFSTTAPTCPSVTTTGADRLIVRAYAAQNYYSTPPASHTLRDGENAFFNSSGLADTDQASAGMTGTGTFSGASPAPWRAFTAAFYVAGDTTPPSLTSATGTATGQTTADLSVSTNEANGTLYGVVTESATAPSAAQVKAGQDHTGSAAVFDDSQAISTTGSKSFSATGLTASTTYYAHYMHEDAATNQSSVVTSSSFTTSAGGTGTAFSSANWAGFDKRPATNPTSALTDFTFLINVANLSADWKSNVQSDGADIRLTKGDDTELPFDLIDWAYNAGSPTGLIRVKWSGTLASSGTQEVKVWSGYTGGTAVAYGASETYGSDNAYDSSTKGYWPLHDFSDRTSNGNDGTGQGSISAGGVTGQVGSATDFEDTTNDYVSIGDVLSAPIGITLRAWIAPDDAQNQTGGGKIISKGIGSTGQREYVLGMSAGSVLVGVADESAGDVDILFGDSTISSGSGVWTHVVGTWDGSDLNIYVNGQVDATPQSTSVAAIEDLTANLKIGKGESASDYFDGKIDEAGIDFVARSAAWIKEEYDQTNDNAAFWGTWAWTATGGSSVSLAYVAIESDEQFGATSVKHVTELSLNAIATAEAFGTLTIETTAQSLVLSGVTSAEGFGTLQLDLVLTPAAITSEESFGSPTVIAGAVVIVPSSLTSAEAFGEPTLAVGAVTLTLVAISSEEAHGEPTVVPGAVTITTNTITSEEAHGEPTVVMGGVTLTPVAVTSEESFGATTISVGSVTVTPETITSGEAFGDLILTLYLTPAAITSEEAHGEPNITLGGVSLVPAAIASAEDFGTSELSLTLSLTGVASNEDFGTQLLTMTLSPFAITTEAAYGSPALHLVVATTGITSQTAYGDPTLSAGSVTVQPAGWDNLSTPGNPVINTGEFILVPSAITSQEAVTTPVITTGALAIMVTGILPQAAAGEPDVLLNLVVTGIAGAEVVSDATVIVGSVDVLPAGITSEAGSGDPVLTTGFNIFSEAIASEEAFGITTLTPEAVVVTTTGIGSDEGLGSPELLFQLDPASITSEEAFGDPILGLGAVTVSPAAIGATLVFGTTAVTTGDVEIVATGIASVSTVTTPEVSVGAVTLTATGIVSQETHGLTELTSRITVLPDGIASQQVLGEPSLVFEIHTQGIVSLGVVEAPIMTVGSVSIIPAGIASLENIPPPIVLIITGGTSGLFSTDDDLFNSVW